MDEYKKVLNNEQWHEVHKDIEINKWQAGLMLGGIFIFILGVAFYIGSFLAQFVEYMVK